VRVCACVKETAVLKNTDAFFMALLCATRITERAPMPTCTALDNAVLPRALNLEAEHHGVFLTGRLLGCKLGLGF
jgi:hypothetical protein